jgi:hypothetical protein
MRIPTRLVRCRFNLKRIARLVSTCRAGTVGAKALIDMSGSSAPVATKLKVEAKNSRSNRWLGSGERDKISAK